MNDERPPKQCRLICYGMIYEDNTDATPQHTLEWRGEILRRSSPEKDDMWKLYASDEKWLWANLSDIEILGRTPGNHTFREKIENGENLLG